MDLDAYLEAVAPAEAADGIAGIVETYLVDDVALAYAVAEADSAEAAGEAEFAAMFGHLDHGYRAEVVDSARYRDGIRPLVADALDEELPETTLLRYEEPEQLLYDMLSDAYRESGLLKAQGRRLRATVGDGTLEDDLLDQGVGAVSVRLLDEMAAMIKGGAFADGPDYAPADTQVIGYAPPNIGSDGMRDYTQVHETVHAAQFGNHPALLEAWREEVRTVTDDLPADPDLFDVVDWLSSAPELPVTTLIEGHAEYYTNEIVERSPRDRDGQERDWTRWLLEQTMLGDKLEQYRSGERFVAALDAAGGTDLTARALEQPPASMAEIGDPQRWADRVVRDR